MNDNKHKINNWGSNKKYLFYFFYARCYYIALLLVLLV